ncbi:hypothetical protein BC829DRAFT_448389 [Chytridium lagenaria]|nr:hypothetical protein BC829DRAFT_448389 [Chytridium lagenaria]
MSTSVNLSAATLVETTLPPQSAGSVEIDAVLAWISEEWTEDAVNYKGTGSAVYFKPESANFRYRSILSTFLLGLFYNITHFFTLYVLQGEEGVPSNGFQRTGQMARLLRDSTCSSFGPMTIPRNGPA